MAPQAVVERRGSRLEACLVGRLAGLRPGLVEDERLDLLGAHDSPDAAAAHRPRRVQLAVAGLDRRAAQHHLAGLTDDHEGHLVAVLALELLDGVVCALHPQVVVDLERDTVLVDEDRPEVVTRGLALDDDGAIAEPRERLAGLAARVRLLDPAREGALAADGDAAAGGGGRAGEHARGEDELVPHAERMTGRIDFLGDDERCHRTAAEAGELAHLLDAGTGSTVGTHVDPKDHVHHCFSAHRHVRRAMAIWP